MKKIRNTTHSNYFKNKRKEKKKKERKKTLSKPESISRLSVCFFFFFLLLSIFCLGIIRVWQSCKYVDVFTTLPLCCVGALALLAVSILSCVSDVLVHVSTLVSVSCGIAGGCICFLSFIACSVLTDCLSVCLFSVALFCLYCACMFLLFANQSGSCAFLRCLRFLRNSFPSSVCIWHDLTSTWPCTIAFVQRPECGLNLTVCPGDSASRVVVVLLLFLFSPYQLVFDICACPRCRQCFCRW